MHKVLVTGASQGIGAEIAKEFAKKGASLILTARSQHKLNEVSKQCRELGSPEVQTLALDLSEPASWIEIVRAASELGIDILVNNAGYGVWGEFAETNLTELQKNMRLNMDALVTLTHQLLPTLRKQEKSYILNVSSTTAYQAIPTFAVYAASKSFVLMWSRALHHELKKFGVTVTALVPGSTTTGFIDRAGMQHMTEAAKKVSMTPQDVAKIGINALYKGKIEVIPGLLNKISAQATYFIPKKWIEKTAGNIYLKK